jgi:hypothetical protein
MPVRLFLYGNGMIIVQVRKKQLRLQKPELPYRLKTSEFRSSQRVKPDQAAMLRCINTG